jgi:protein O-mannosyl-transferase
MQDDFSFKNLFIPLTTTKAIHFIVLIGFIVFANSLFNGFVADDDGQVVQNVTIQSLANIPQFFSGGTFYGGDINQNTGTYYRPIVSTCYAFIYSLFGLNAFPFHLFQILIHISNAILVFLILRFFLKKNALSLLLCLFFLVHPIQAEAVDYIADLQDVLFFFFGSLAFYLSLRWNYSLKHNSIITCLLLLSVFSKETGIIFVGLILLYTFIFKNAHRLQTTCTYLSVLFIYFFMRLVFTHGLGNPNTFSLIEQSPFGIRLATIPLELFFYFKTLFFPFQLSLNQMWIFSFDKIGLFAISVCIDLALVIALCLFLKSLKKSHEELYKQCLFFTIWFAVGLFLHMHIIMPLDATVADRWFYFPFVGLLGMLGIVFAIYFKKGKSQRILLGILGMLIVFFAVITMIRNSQFHDNYSLLSHDIVYSENNSYMHSALAIELMNQKRFNEAYEHLQRSIRLNPKGDVNWNILGHYYQKKRKLKKAQNAYVRSIQNAKYYLSYEDLSLLLLTNSTPKETEQFTRGAVTAFPTDGKLWLIYALATNELGMKQEARIAAEKAAVYFPNEQTYRLYTLLNDNEPVTFTSHIVPEGTTLYICSNKICR